MDRVPLLTFAAALGLLNSLHGQEFAQPLEVNLVRAHLVDGKVALELEALRYVTAKLDGRSSYSYNVPVIRQATLIADGINVRVFDLQGEEVGSEQLPMRWGTKDAVVMSPTGKVPDQLQQILRDDTLVLSVTGEVARAHAKLLNTLPDDADYSIKGRLEIAAVQPKLDGDQVTLRLKSLRYTTIQRVWWVDVPGRESERRFRTYFRPGVSSLQWPVDGNGLRAFDLQGNAVSAQKIPGRLDMVRAVILFPAGKVPPQVQRILRDHTLVLAIAGRASYSFSSKGFPPDP